MPSAKGGRLDVLKYYSLAVKTFLYLQYIYVLYPEIFDLSFILYLFRPLKQMMKPFPTWLRFRKNICTIKSLKKSESMVAIRALKLFFATFICIGIVMYKHVRVCLIETKEIFCKWTSTPNYLKSFLNVCIFILYKFIAA
jgi:hypothetical protein